MQGLKVSGGIKESVQVSKATDIELRDLREGSGQRA